MATVHFLPLEIIAEVVHFITYQSERYPVALHRLAQVCVRWRDLILSHPPFWAIIDEAFGMRWAGWAVKRAKNVPLTFLYMSDSPERSGRPERLHRVEAFVDCLMQNLHRCGVVILAPNDRDATGMIIPNTVQQLLHIPDLSLSSFVFCIQSSRAPLRPLSRDYLRRVAHKTEQTRTMTISLGMFARGSPLARNLTHLKLFRGTPNLIGWDEPLRIEVLVDTLQACPTLESLELESFKIPGMPSNALSTIHLPKLKRLALTFVPVDVAYALLPVVDAPCCEVLTMSLDPTSNLPLEHVYDVLDAAVFRTVCENMNGPFSAFDNFWAQAATELDDRIAVSIVPTGLPGQLLIFIAGVEDKPRAFRQIFSFLPDAVFSTRQLELSLLAHSPSLCSTLARRFPLIDSLTVEIVRGGCWEDFLEFLTTQRLPGDEHLVWPALESLIVVSEIGEDCLMTFETGSLVDFLQARIEILHGQSTGTEPRKFKKFHFKGKYEGLDGIDWADLVEDFDMDQRWKDVGFKR